jgi:hypothetical protein
MTQKNEPVSCLTCSRKGRGGSCSFFTEGTARQERDPRAEGENNPFEMPFQVRAMAGLRDDICS